MALCSPMSGQAAAKCSQHERQGSRNMRAAYARLRHLSAPPWRSWPRRCRTVGVHGDTPAGDPPRRELEVDAGGYADRKVARPDRGLVLRGCEEPDLERPEPARSPERGADMRGVADRLRHL